MDGHVFRKENGLRAVFYLLISVMLLMTTSSNTVKAETFDQLKDAREDYMERFRISGERDPGKAKAIENGLKSLQERSRGKLLAKTLFELASIQRMTNQFEKAIENYKFAAVVAKENQDSATEFDAWVGVAKSHVYGTHNHGAAAAAFERAVVCAGITPTQKQRYEIFDYLSQLQAGRGELESALLNGLQATKYAQDSLQYFYAFLDTGDVLQKFAESCDFRKIVDAKSNSENDPWGACKRAVRAAGSFYEKAKMTADKAGWAFLGQSAQGFINRLDTRLFLINQKANFERIGQTNVFNAGHVLVNESFPSGGSELAFGLPLGVLIEQLLPEAQAKDPRSMYLMGIKADLDGNPTKALEYYQNAAQLLGTERDSLFDIRQRGTVVENRPELIRDLALRLLAFQRYDEAFVVFESLRSHGLEWLATAFAKGNFTDAERGWIAGLVQLDSLISAKQNGLVETALAGIQHSHSLELLDELDGLNNRRLEQQNLKKFQPTVKKLKSIECAIPNLTELKTLTREANIPVLLYWVTPTNVVVWAVSSKGVEVKTVFLPEAAVVDKAGRLRDSLSSTGRVFDDESAKDLYAFLIKPFEKHLTQSQVIIIPQGPLIGLPFEALIDGGDGKYLAEKFSVSYAPNAAFAFRAIKGSLPDTRKITAIYDNKIENDTHEISRMQGLAGVQVDPYSSKDLDAEKMIGLLGNTGIVHVLLHGEYDYDDPLQSKIKIGRADSRHGGFVTAAELLAADWSGTQLAVFSSCEGAVIKTRISNEQFGISWALLAGGADNVVLSRWRVNAASNAAWMEFFYKNLLAAKMSPALAANAARRSMLDSDKTHPYYWAGPQVFGR